MSVSYIHCQFSMVVPGSATLQRGFEAGLEPGVPRGEHWRSLVACAVRTFTCWWSLVVRTAHATPTGGRLTQQTSRSSDVALTTRPAHRWHQHLSTKPCST